MISRSSAICPPCPGPMNAPCRMSSSATARSGARDDGDLSDDFFARRPSADRHHRYAASSGPGRCLRVLNRPGSLVVGICFGDAWRLRRLCLRGAGNEPCRRQSLPGKRGASWGDGQERVFRRRFGFPAAVEFRCYGADVGDVVGPSRLGAPG